MPENSTSLFQKVMKDINTGIDGVSYNNIKIGTNAAVAVFLFIGVVIVLRLDSKELANFPWLGFGGAVATILFGGAGGEAVKQLSKTEPKEG